MHEISLFDFTNIQYSVNGFNVKYLSYVRFNGIITTILLTGLTDGNWKQVAVWSEQGFLKLYVDGIMKDYEDDRMPLLTYLQVPFKDMG